MWWSGVEWGPATGRVVRQMVTVALPEVGNFWKSFFPGVWEGVFCGENICWRVYGGVKEVKEVGWCGGAALGGAPRLVEWSYGW